MSGARVAALALVLTGLLAGCGGFTRATGNALPGTEDSPEHRACQQEARTSPEMKRLDAQRMPTNDFNWDRIAREEKSILLRNYRSCLRARGLAMPGGVAAEVPR